MLAGESVWLVPAPGMWEISWRAARQFMQLAEGDQPGGSCQQNRQSANSPADATYRRRMSEDATGAQAAPGWYPTANLGVLRYWDGGAWTEHHAPDPAVLAQTSHQSQATDRGRVGLVAIIAFVVLIGGGMIASGNDNDNSGRRMQNIYCESQPVDPEC